MIQYSNCLTQTYFFSLKADRMERTKELEDSVKLCHLL